MKLPISRQIDYADISAAELFGDVIAILEDAAHVFQIGRRRDVRRAGCWRARGGGITGAAFLGGHTLDPDQLFLLLSSSSLQVDNDDPLININIANEVLVTKGPHLHRVAARSCWFIQLETAVRIGAAPR